MGEDKREKFINISKTTMENSYHVCVQDDDGDMDDIEKRALRIIKKLGEEK